MFEYPDDIPAFGVNRLPFRRISSCANECFGPILEPLMDFCVPIRKAKTTGPIVVTGAQITKRFAIINNRHHPGVINGIGMFIDKNPQLGGVGRPDVAHFVISGEFGKPGRTTGGILKRSSFDKSIERHTADSGQILFTDSGQEFVRGTFVNLRGTTGKTARALILSGLRCWYYRNY